MDDFEQTPEPYRPATAWRGGQARPDLAVAENRIYRFGAGTKSIILPLPRHAIYESKRALWIEILDVEIPFRGKNQLISSRLPDGEQAPQEVISREGREVEPAKQASKRIGCLHECRHRLRSLLTVDSCAIAAPTILETDTAAAKSGCKQAHPVDHRRH
ncbi:hypothetical protein [Aurantimonas sp. A3-2-R12]|uniref:hypothetical protein n=1 Tax=Aurantimonas sp. A3-2-R12 TaxID=3114362 RepID=UPI002E19ED13|nr:hypothetical protein [Aurantimonas sp. A3-2-R12]